MSSEPPGSIESLKSVSLGRRERALKVWEMFEGGAKVGQIAELFHISERMVYKDLNVAKGLNKEMVQTLDQGELLGGEIAFWRQVVRQALRDYHLSQNDSARVGFLRVAIDARAKLVKLLQDTGLITTVPTRISLEEGNPFSDPEFRQKYIALMKEAKAKGIKIYGL